MSGLTSGLWPMLSTNQSAKLCGTGCNASVCEILKAFWQCWTPADGPEYVCHTSTYSTYHANTTLTRALVLHVALTPIPSRHSHHAIIISSSAKQAQQTMLACWESRACHSCDVNNPRGHLTSRPLHQATVMAYQASTARHSSQPDSDLKLPLPQGTCTHRHPARQLKHGASFEG